MNAENKICAEARPIIQVNNLTKSFGKLEVLKGISETIYEGEDSLYHWSQRRRKKHLSPAA